MELKINTVSNGLILEIGSDQTQSKTIVVFEKKEEYGTGEECAKAYLVHILYEILEQLGEYGSKHDEHRVRIQCHCHEEFDAYDEEGVLSIGDIDGIDNMLGIPDFRKDSSDIESNKESSIEETEVVDGYGESEEYDKLDEYDEPKKEEAEEK